MSTEQAMLPWKKARELILGLSTPLGPETVELSAASGRILTTDIVSTRQLPPWDNSAMDGYAVRAADVTVGAKLPVSGTIAAGHPAETPLVAGTAMRIMTGAPMPALADAVIMREEADEADGQVSFRKAPRPGQHVRRAGEDVQPGSTVLLAGALLSAGEIGILAALGRLLVSVHRRPSVAIVSTGDELVRADEQPHSGQIVNSNAHCLLALVEQAGCRGRILPIARDTKEDLQRCFAEAFSADVVISSGGVSVGDFDFVKQVFAELGAKERFFRVAMKPGKPLVFSTVEQHGRLTLLFGLPGNPASSLVSFELFVYPALRRLLGHPVAQAAHPLAMVRIAEPIRPDRERTHFTRALVTRSAVPPYELWAKPLTQQGSGMLRSLVGMNALLEVPPGEASLPAGSELCANLLSVV
ncbi:MAG TPA: molybdopterin molybdotransferase MoeA [Pseudomonadota bacterium]|nr:molybdopterin molybdotransferase MoeA [Pseudomonadota bacterium]